MIGKWLARIVVLITVLGVLAWMLHDYGLHGLGIGSPTEVRFSANESVVKKEYVFKRGLSAVDRYRIQFDAPSRLVYLSASAASPGGRAELRNGQAPLTLYVDRESSGIQIDVLGVEYIDVAAQKDPDQYRAATPYELVFERTVLPDADQLTFPSDAWPMIARVVWKIQEGDSGAPRWTTHIQGSPGASGVLSMLTNQTLPILNLPPALDHSSATISVRGGESVTVCLATVRSGRPFFFRYLPNFDRWRGNSMGPLGLAPLGSLDLAGVGEDLELTLPESAASASDTAGQRAMPFCEGGFLGRQFARAVPAAYKGPWTALESPIFLRTPSSDKTSD